jgi:hypothetical protein
VYVKNGVFDVQLGAVLPLAVADFAAVPLYLEIKIFASGSGWETFDPRQPFTATAFAFRAAEADTLDGRTVADLDAAYVNAGEANAVSSAMIADSVVTAADLASNSVGAAEIAASAVGSSEIDDGSVTAADLAEDYVNTAGDSMTGPLNLAADLNVSGSSANSSDYVATFTSSGGQYAYAIQGVANSANYYARGLYLDVDSVNSLATGAYIDVDAPESSATGIDVNATGRLSNTIGIVASAYSTEGYAQGLRIDANASSASASGVLGINANTYHDGTGYLHGIDIDANHYGSAGEAIGVDINIYGSDSGDAKGVYAVGRKSAGDTAGAAYGGPFIGDNDRDGTNDHSYGVLGEASGANGTRYGLYGRTVTSGDTEYNYAVYGQASTTDYYAYGFYANVDLIGTDALEAYGAVYSVEANSAADGSIYGVYADLFHSGASGNVYGLATGVYASDSGNAYGIYSYTPSSYTTGNAYAGYFSGNVHVTGTLSKGGGSFKIDHPLDPENKYLQHSFVESPDMMNVYNGNVTLGADGQAWVDLPDYFDALNRDFRYQLTCIGGFAPVYIAEKIDGNRFQIAGGTPGLEISWQVTGIRRDAWAEANRIQVEVDKDEAERGSYLAPEAFGLDATRSVEYARDPDMMESALKRMERSVE